MNVINSDFHVLRKELNPLIEKNEKNRKLYRFFKLLSLFVFQLFYLIVTTLPIIHIVINRAKSTDPSVLKLLSISSNPLYISIGIGVCAFIFSFLNTPAKVFKKLYKANERKIVSSILKKTAPELKYSTKVGIKKEHVNGSQLFSIGKEVFFKTHGTLSGKINESNLIIGSIITNKSPSKLKTIFLFLPLGTPLYFLSRLIKPWFSSKTIEQSFSDFLGMFAVIDFNKKLNGTTVVLPDQFEKRIGYLAKTIQSLNFKRDELVNLEDPEFEEGFVVYSTDQIEARYILTPSLMQRIVALKKKNDKPIMLSFAGNQLYMAVWQPYGFLSLPENKNLVTSDALETFYRDIITTIGVVEDLNLTNRIWG